MPIAARCVIGGGLVGAVLIGALGCQLERLFPEKVGAGAARLTVRNAVKLVSVIDDDPNCGFANPRVLESFTTEGSIGEQGRVIWRTERCEIDLGSELVVLSTDCNGVDTIARGKLTISATRTVEGLLTGNQAQPVIPLSPDAVVFDISADVQDYELRLSDKITILTMQQAHIEERVHVHLAQSASLGVCTVDTSDVTIESIVVTDAKYRIHDGSHEFDVDVPLVDISAQLGIYNGVENEIHGKIQVWDTEVDLSHDTVLDPDYDAEEFRNAFSCKEDLKLPVEYVCKPLTPRLAVGAAKLTVNNVGNAISAVVDDTQCGFASPGVMQSAVINGVVGRDGGEVVYRIDRPCTVSFPVKTLVKRDCLGTSTYAEGTAHITGTMRVRGRLTGDPLTPVIPTSRDPAEVLFEIEFDAFEVTTDASDSSMQSTGRITGRMKPRMAIDTQTGACSISTPVVTFEDLAWEPGSRGLVRSGGNALMVNIDGSLLDAQNGNKDGVENKLEGNISVDGQTFVIPLEGPAVLNPDYDAAEFLSAFSCTPNMEIPTSDKQCDFHDVIGNGAARLVVQAVGTIASMINKDDNCGYETFSVKINPDEVEGEPGEMGSLTWHIEDCSIGSDEVFVQSESCTGDVTYVGGFANVTSTRTVRGERETLFWLFDSIIPRDPQSVDLWLEDVELENFQAYSVPAGQSHPPGKLTIHSGTLSAFVRPATGERADEEGRFDVPTPVATLSEVHLRNASATLESQGKLFSIDIADSTLTATNGSIGGVTNQIAGSIMIDGDRVDIHGPLNPTYNQQSFDQSYACTENLAGPVR